MSRRKHIPSAEQAYQAALELAASDRPAEAVTAYQHVIDRYPESLWSDRAAGDLDRLGGATQYIRRGTVVRVPPELSVCRRLTLRHGAVTMLLMALLAIVTGPLFAGVWTVFLGMGLGGIPLFYWAGTIPAGVTGLVFAAWGLRYCHHRRALPERTVLAGILCGLIGSVIGALMILFLWQVFHFWFLVAGLLVLVGLLVEGNLTSAIFATTILFAFHGALGGAGVGWLGGRLLRHRMDAANDCGTLNAVPRRYK